MAVDADFVVPAPCISMAKQNALVSLPLKMLQEVISQLSRDYQKMAIIRCKKPGLLKMFHSAVIASLVRS